MIRNFLLLFFVAIATSTSARSYEVVYQPQDSLKVVNLLADARRKHSDTNLMLYFARCFKGLPYVAHTLEVSPKKEKLVINLRQMDCTTLVENVVALTLCMKQKNYTFAAFCENLRLLRYRGGASPAYEARLHYFTDWITDNTAMGYCYEVQSPTPPFNAIQTINVYFMSTHPDKYVVLKTIPTLVPKIAETEQNLKGRKFKYIPTNYINNTKQMRNIVHDGDIIATTTVLKGLDIQHLGFAVWKKDGLHMLNASSLHHKVVEEPMLLRTYLKRQKSMNGIRIVRVK